MQITEQNRQGLIDKMGQSWLEVLQPFIESEAWDNIFRTLKQTSQSGKMVIPKSNELFSSYKLCPRDKVRAIVIMQCPYATQRVGVTIACGVPMDCRNTEPYQQPTLYQWYLGLESQYGFSPDNDLRLNLEYLLAEEGVLLINSALSVEKDKVDSHAQLWQPFTRYVLEHVVSKIMCGLPIALIGAQAQKYEQYINPLCHHIIKVEHPAAASHNGRNWKHENMHKKMSDIVYASTGEHINWLRKKGEVITTTKKKAIQENIEDDLPF